MKEADQSDEIFVPDVEDHDSEAEALMHMGKTEEDPENDLRDPWFFTEEGQKWLSERGE